MSEQMYVSVEVEPMFYDKILYMVRTDEGLYWAEQNTDSVVQTSTSMIPGLFWNFRPWEGEMI